MSEHTVKYEIASLLEATAFDNSDSKLGAVSGVFLDDGTKLPTFVEVHHGLFGRSSSIVPLRGSKLDAHRLTLGFEKDTVKDAPDIDPDNGLSTSEQDAIFVHYGLLDAQDADYFNPDQQSGKDQTDPSNTAPTNDRDASADGTPAGTGVGAGAPAGAARSDADSTVNTETHVDATHDVHQSSRATGEERIRLRRFSDRQTGTVKW